MTQLATGLGGQIGFAEEAYTQDVWTVSVTGSPTGGSFGVACRGQTATIAYNATAAQVATALNALATIPAGGVTTTGGALPGSAVTVHSVAKGVSLDLVIDATANNLTGGASPTGVTTNTTPSTGYGSGATPNRFPVAMTPSDSVKLDIQTVESAAILQNNVMRRSYMWALNRKGVSGTQGFEMKAIGFALLLQHMFGATPTIATPTNGVKTRTFTYTGPQPLANLANRSLCWQRGIPTNQGVLSPRTAKGVKIAQWELSAAIDQFVTGQVTLDGQDEDNTTVLTAPTYPVEPAAQPGSGLFWTGANVSVGGSVTPVKKFDLTVNRNLDTARYSMADTYHKLEPVEQALADVKLSVDTEYQDDSLWELWTAGETATVTASFQGALIEAVSPSYYYGLTLTLPTCRLDGADPELSTLGVIPVTIPLDVLYDGVNGPITAVLTTTDTAV